MKRYKVTISRCRIKVKDIPAKNKADARDRAFEYLLAVFGVDYTDNKVLKIEFGERLRR